MVTNFENFSIEEIAKMGDCSLDVVLSLVDGVTKGQLDELFDGSKAERELHRMNVVGSLRGQGFEISGGRRGGPIYQLKGWSKPETPDGTESWTEEDLERLREVHSLPTMTVEDSRMMASHLRTSSDRRRMTHENSILQILSYEAPTRGRAHLWSLPSGSLVAVIQKFVHRPSFKVLNFDASADELVRVAQTLVPISYRDVSIGGLEESHLPVLKEAFPAGSIERHDESVLETERIARQEGMSKTERWNNRRSSGDTEFFEIGWGAEGAQGTIIEEWKSVVGKKQRQLSIRRDYVAMLTELDSKITFLGFRDGLPVCLQILDHQVRFPGVSQIVEKSLNYRQMPGGRSGTTDFSLWKTCTLLHERGVEYFNMGQIAGGTEGLASHKKAIDHWRVQEIGFRTGMHRES